MLAATDRASSNGPTARAFAVNARGTAPTPAIDAAAGVVAVLPATDRRAFAIPYGGHPAFWPLAAFATATAIPTGATESRFARLRVVRTAGHAAEPTRLAHTIPVTVDHAVAACADAVDDPRALLISGAEARVRLAVWNPRRTR